MEGSIVNVIKNSYKKHTANIILDPGKIEASLLSSRTRQGYLLSVFLFKIILKFLANALRQEK
jgi:hypothetical protein